MYLLINYIYPSNLPRILIKYSFTSNSGVFPNDGSRYRITNTRFLYLGLPLCVVYLCSRLDRYSNEIQFDITNNNRFIFISEEFSQIRPRNIKPLSQNQKVRLSDIKIHT